MIYSIYYSPTGGCRSVSDVIASVLDERFVRIDLMDKNMSGHTFSKSDLCVIAVPAFGGRVPKNAEEKLRLLKSDGAFAVLVAVFGNRAIDDTLAELYDLTASVGFSPIACIEAVAEHSLVRAFGAGRPNEKDRSQLKDFAKQILEKSERNEGSIPCVPGNRPYKEYKLSAMIPTVDDTCIRCGKCASECPADAIPHDDVKTVDAQKCFSCMHCTSVCPVNARHNAKSITNALYERLRDRCSEAKENKLYI